MDQVDYSLYLLSILCHPYQRYSFELLSVHYWDSLRLSRLSIFLFAMLTSSLGQYEGLPADPIWTLMCQPQLSISYLLFVDDCLLLGRAFLRNVVTSKILEQYCHASGQRVNLFKSFIFFNPITKAHLRYAIRQTGCYGAGEGP